MVLIVKMHNSPNGMIIAVCDPDILGKKFEEGDLQLDLASRFYRGEEKTKEETAKLFKACYQANLVGEKAVALGIKEGIIDESHVIKVDGVPHAMAVIVSDS